MKNKKAAMAAMIIGCQYWLFLIWMGIRIIRKYANDPANWHFIAGLAGTILAVGLLGAGLAGIYLGLSRFKSSKQIKA